MCRPPEGIHVSILVTPAAVDDIVPLELEVEQTVRDLTKLESGWTVWCASVGPKGVVVGGHAVEETGAEMVVTFIAADSKDVRGRDFT